MRVLAIDPGYDRFGVAILENSEGKEHLLFSTCIETDRSLPHPKRLASIGQELDALLTTYKPDAVAVETLFFNKNQKTAGGVFEARGITLYIAELHGCSIFEFGPQEVKIAMTGFGKSDKHAVFEMVHRLVPNAPEKALDDEFDAIAIGVTCLAHHGNAANRLIS
jgi:crossover junction endodeoxyribonuclease RuvC